MQMIKVLDKIYLQKYLYLLSLLCSAKIEVPEFEELFMQIKADDEYWRSGMFDQKITEVLDALFLDIRDYSLDYLYDRNDFVNVNLISSNEAEVKNKAEQALSKLKESFTTY